MVNSKTWTHVLMKRSAQIVGLRSSWWLSAVQFSKPLDKWWLLHAFRSGPNLSVLFRITQILLPGSPLTVDPTTLTLPKTKASFFMAETRWPIRGRIRAILTPTYSESRSWYQARWLIYCPSWGGKPLQKERHLATDLLGCESKWP